MVKFLKKTEKDGTVHYSASGTFADGDMLKKEEMDRILAAVKKIQFGVSPLTGGVDDRIPGEYALPIDVTRYERHDLATWEPDPLLQGELLDDAQLAALKTVLGDVLDTSPPDPNTKIIEPVWEITDRNQAAATIAEWAAAENITKADLEKVLFTARWIPHVGYSPPPDPVPYYVILEIALILAEWPQATPRLKAEPIKELLYMTGLAAHGQQALVALDHGARQWELAKSQANSDPILIDRKNGQLFNPFSQGDLWLDRPKTHQELIDLQKKYAGTIWIVSLQAIIASLALTKPGKAIKLDDLVKLVYGGRDNTTIRKIKNKTRDDKENKRNQRRIETWEMVCILCNLTEHYEVKEGKGKASKFYDSILWSVSDRETPNKPDWPEGLPERFCIVPHPGWQAGLESEREFYTEGLLQVTKIKAAKVAGQWARSIGFNVLRNWRLNTKGDTELTRGQTLSLIPDNTKEHPRHYFDNREGERRAVPHYIEAINLLADAGIIDRSPREGETSGATSLEKFLNQRLLFIPPPDRSARMAEISKKRGDRVATLAKSRKKKKK